MERKHLIDLAGTCLAAVIGVATASLAKHYVEPPPPPPLIHITKPSPAAALDADLDNLEEPLVNSRGDSVVLNNRACL
jgi:hypothetical protein